MRCRSLPRGAAPGPGARAIAQRRGVARRRATPGNARAPCPTSTCTSAPPSLASTENTVPTTSTRALRVSTSQRRGPPGRTRKRARPRRSNTTNSLALEASPSTRAPGNASMHEPSANSTRSGAPASGPSMLAKCCASRVNSGPAASGGHCVPSGRRDELQRDQRQEQDHAAAEQRRSEGPASPRTSLPPAELACALAALDALPHAAHGPLIDGHRGELAHGDRHPQGSERRGRFSLVRHAPPARRASARRSARARAYRRAECDA